MEDEPHQMENEPAGNPEDNPNGNPLQRAARVLVVDDEPDVLESTGMLLRDLGYEAIRLGEAGLILDTVEAEHPDIILQDLTMPGLNVAGLVASLRVHPATADIPVIFFSARGDLSVTAARYDVYGYLAKPFGRDELSHLLKQVLAGKAASPLAVGKDPQRELRAVFHDYWNLIAALGTYVDVLDHAPGQDLETQRVMHGLNDLILKIEAKTDRLRAYMLAMAGSLSAEADDAPGRAGRGNRHSMSP